MHGFRFIRELFVVEYAVRHYFPLVQELLKLSNRHMLPLKRYAFFKLRHLPFLIITSETHLILELPGNLLLLHSLVESLTDVINVSDFRLVKVLVVWFFMGEIVGFF